MKRLMFAAALVLAVSAVPASASVEMCGIESQYDVSLDSNRLLFEKTGQQPAKVEMRRGRLFVDGRELALSERDTERVAKYEATVRALVPQAKAIARDATEIAFTAVTEVVAAFVGDSKASATRARLGDVQRSLIDRIDASFYQRPWHEDEFDNVVESAVKELMPVILAEVAGTAVTIALSGDEAASKALEARTANLEKDIERRIDTQTRQLAARAAALCPMIAELGAIELAMDLKLDGGGRLKLIELEKN